MNWGLKITLLYVSFVLLILGMVGLAMHEKMDLVANDYYEQELNYQNKINTVNHTRALGESLTWEVKKNTLELTFPEQFKEKKISGNVYFFRPSDATMDKTIAIPTDTARIQNISTSQLKKGVYKMQISWEVNKEKYYNEGIVQIN